MLEPRPALDMHSVDPADAILGAGLPVAAEKELAIAAGSYHLEDIAEAHLHAAARLAPGHAAVLIGLYRFYFYKGRLADALEIAEMCLEKACHENGIEGDWSKAKPTDANFDDFGAVIPRFFLFSLKGYAYLQMRLGALEEGRRAVMKLLYLDPSDKIGAKVLLGVLDRMGAPDED